MENKYLEHRSIYYTEEVILATGETVIRIYDLIGGSIELIYAINASTDQDAENIVEKHLKGKYKSVNRL